MLYLVRHGQTEFNAEGRFQGHLDSPLTALGVDQAERVGNLLHPLVDDLDRVRVISSPLGRTLHTARIIAGRSGLAGDPQIEPRLIEISVGAWEGRTRDEILAEHPAPSPGMLFESPGGETYDQVSARLSSWLSEIDPADGLQRIVVTHGVAGRVLRGLYAGLVKDEVLTLPTPQDAVFRLSDGRIERLDCAPAALAFEPR
jgi:broad specificity phosphatase PhoE